MINTQIIIVSNTVVEAGKQFLELVQVRDDVTWIGVIMVEVKEVINLEYT